MITNDNKFVTMKFIVLPGYKSVELEYKFYSIKFPSE